MIFIFKTLILIICYFSKLKGLFCFFPFFIKSNKTYTFSCYIFVLKYIYLLILCNYYFIILFLIVKKQKILYLKISVQNRYLSFNKYF